MSTVIIRKDAAGHWAGVGEADQARWERWRRRVADADIGATLSFTWKEPRSPKHHGLFFAQLAALFERQEQFDSADKLRTWLTVGAGWCDFAPGPTGRMVAIPRSIAWDRMDQGEFGDLHAAVNAFLWSEHARRFLWPHLSDQQTYALVADLLQEFDR